MVKTIFFRRIMPIFVLLILSLNGFLFSDAYAYLDPGTGSIILQSLVGVFVGILITLKIYWQKIRYRLSK